MLTAWDAEPVATAGKVTNVRFAGTEVFYPSEPEFPQLRGEFSGLKKGHPRLTAGCCARRQKRFGIIGPFRPWTPLNRLKLLLRNMREMWMQLKSRTSFASVAAGLKNALRSTTRRRNMQTVNQFEATYRIPREFSRFRQAIIYAEDACAAVHSAIVLSSGAQLVGIRKVA
jgi:hypothetical protein